MIDIIEDRRKKSKKTHMCYYCGKTIEKGEEYEYQKSVCDGIISEFHTHIKCSEVASAIWDYVDPDEGMKEEDFRDGCHDVCSTFLCPDCEHWNRKEEGCEEGKLFCIDKMHKLFQTHELYMDKRKGFFTYWKCRRKENG